MENNWITCPKKKTGGKVSIQICRKVCKTNADCKAFKEAQEDTPPIQPLKKGKVAKSTPPVSKEGAEKGILDTDVVKDLAENPGDTDKIIHYGVNPDFTEVHYAVASHTPEKPSVSRAMVLFNRAIAIRQEIGTKFLEMGEVLQLIAEAKCYRELGYENEESFAEAVLNIRGRTAAYLRSIYCYQIKYDLPKDPLAAIGWAKVKEIMKVAKTKEDALKWIEKAGKPGMTVDGLYEEIQIAQGKKTREEVQEKPKKISFTVFPGQEEIWDRAIEVGKKVTGSESVGHIVTGAILPDFLATYSDGEGFGSKAALVLIAVKTFEMAYKVKVDGEISDTETGEILVEKRE